MRRTYGYSDGSVLMGERDVRLRDRDAFRYQQMNDHDHHIPEDIEGWITSRRYRDNQSLSCSNGIDIGIII